jgi:hypothetical protein
MSDAVGYFQFPLCALAMGNSPRERLDQIVSFGFVEAGFVMFRKLAPEIQKLLADELRDYSGTPSDYRKANPDHVAAMLGAREIGIKAGNIGSSLKNWREVTEFRDRFQSQHGRDAEVRARKDLVFEVRDNQGMSYREFAVYCALLSCIGAKEHPVRVIRKQIQCRMLGYKSPSIMGTEIARRKDGAMPLTPRQINYTLDKLYERKFFVRARPNRRQTYYSVRLTQEQLENALVELKTYSQEFHECRRRRDADLIARIKQRRTAIKVNNPIIVDNGPENRMNGAQPASADTSAAVSAVLSTLIKTPVIETPSIKTPST